MVVVTVAGLLVVVVVFDPDASWSCVLPPAAVVVVVLAAGLWSSSWFPNVVLSDVFLEAEGVDEPHAAAISPPASDDDAEGEGPAEATVTIVWSVGENRCGLQGLSSSFLLFVLRTGSGAGVRNGHCRVRACAWGPEGGVILDQKRQQCQLR